MLLDPFEEQFDFPAGLVEMRDRQCRQVEVVGEKHQSLIGCGVVEPHAPQGIGIDACGLIVAQDHGVVGEEAAFQRHGAGVAPVELHVLLATHDIEGRAKNEGVKPGEVEIAAVHDVERTGLRREFVEDVDVVPAGWANADKRRDRAAQVEQRVQFDRRFGAAKASPREQRQTQVDGGGIEGIDGGVEIGADGLVSVHRTGDADEHLRQVFPHAPAMSLVGVGQRRTGDVSPESQMVKPVCHRTQAGFDVTKALTACQLGEGHRKKLIHAGETTMPPILAVAADATMKLVSGKVVDQLREDGTAGVHGPLSAPKAVFQRGRKAQREFKSKTLREGPNLPSSSYLRPLANSLAGQ